MCFSFKLKLAYFDAVKVYFFLIHNSIKKKKKKKKKTVSTLAQVTQKGVKIRANIWKENRRKYDC